MPVSYSSKRARQHPKIRSRTTPMELASRRHRSTLPGFKAGAQGSFQFYLGDGGGNARIFVLRRQHYIRCRAGRRINFGYLHGAKLLGLSGISLNQIITTSRRLPGTMFRRMLGGRPQAAPSRACLRPPASAAHKVVAVLIIVLRNHRWAGTSSKRRCQLITLCRTGASKGSSLISIG